jgi:flagellar operon protein
VNERIYNPIPGIGTGLPRIPSTTATPSQGTDFQRILDQKLGGELKFSAHAQQRLASRQIRLTTQEMDGLKEAVGKAEAKGARESLVVMDRVALVVSVKNRTVITAVDAGSMKDNVFTQIDSAVIVRK